MDKPVYSTANKSSEQKRQHGKKGKASFVKGSGPTKMRLETKGRGGKAATILFQLPMEECDARALLKDLQTTLSCGATMKGSELIFQGDLRDRIEQFCKDRGLKIVRAGG